MAQSSCAGPKDSTLCDDRCPPPPAIVATNMVRKSGIAWLLCALLLAGCVTHGRLDGALPQTDPQTAAEIAVIRTRSPGRPTGSSRTAPPAGPSLSTASSSHERPPPPCSNREPKTDRDGLRLAARGATSREDPDSIAASAEGWPDLDEVLARRPPSPAASIEDE
jgi:hypothetical protein